ncbi:MAG: peptidase C25, partial [Thermoplasmatales archaeon]
MKKKISILVVGILVLSGLGAVAVTDEHPEISRNVKITESITFFKQPEFVEEDEFLRVNFEGATSWLINPG